jgi:DNA-binding transcriptional MocR family regulator
MAWFLASGSAVIDDAVRRAATAGVGLQAIASMVVDNEPTAGLLFGYRGIATEHIEEGLARLRAAFSRGDSR